MDIKLPIKIHNKFEIEVKDIKTGEIVQKGYAENIILDNLYARLLSNYASLSHIQIGSGTGELSKARTSLFNRINGKVGAVVELVLNQPPTPCHKTMSISILPAENIDAIITEVGLAYDVTGSLVTHALIKDSEGNPLALGPKTSTQEITIYSTLYGAVVNYYDVDFPITANGNEFLGFLVGEGMMFLSESPPNNTTNNGICLVFSNDGSPTNLTTNYIAAGLFNTGAGFGIYDVANKTRKTSLIKVLTSQGNGKIKSLTMNRVASATVLRRPLLRMLFPNPIFEGWEFDKTPVGIGDGVQTVFNLTWDEAKTDKSYTVYVDGIVKETGVTFNAGNITFDTAPADGAIITADYWVDYIPKDNNYELWGQLYITLEEGSPS